MNEIAGAIAGLNLAFNVLKGAMAARDDALIKAAQIDLQEKLLNASTTALSQVQSTHALELEAQQLRADLVQANARVQAVERELEKRGAYKMAQPAPGQWARLPVGAVAGSPEDTAYFCATCYSEGKEVPLQYRKAGPGYNAGLYCQVSQGHSLNLGGALPAPPRQRTAIATPRW
ncbi:MAG: hypothetical protein ACK4OE_15395 [Acidovorax sp.]|uniref:hypothetical protein n=1 Tax=Acidovorax sp. TaxID=1872122 RepID=UPI0015F3C560